jgi:hypothetical protein
MLIGAQRAATENSAASDFRSLIPDSRLLTPDLQWQHLISSHSFETEFQPRTCPVHNFVRNFTRPKQEKNMGIEPFCRDPSPRQ